LQIAQILIDIIEQTRRDDLHEPDKNPINAESLASNAGGSTSFGVA